MADKKTNKKALDKALRAKYLNAIVEMLTANGDEILRTGSQEIAIPTLNAEGMDEYVVITVKVPQGSREGDPYDAYEIAEDYKRKQAEKAEKAKEAAAKKAAKVERDKADREAKAKAKANHRTEEEV